MPVWIRRGPTEGRALSATATEPRLTAREWARMLAAPIKDKRYLSTQLGGDVAEYLSWAQNEAGKRPRTLDQYERDLSRLCILSPHLDRHSVTKAEIRETIASFPEGSRHRVWAALSDFWKWQYNEERVEHSPMRGIRAPKKPPRKLPEVFTDLERARLIEAQAASPMPIVDTVRLLILLELGVRKNEARLMRVRDLDPASRYAIIRNAKGGDERGVPFGEDLQRALIDFLHSPLPLLEREPAPDEFVFFPSGGTNKRGYAITWVDPTRAMGETTFWRWWNRVVERSGVRYRKPHTTRHSFATDLLDATDNLVTVKEALGHKNIAVTEEYIHGQRARLRKGIDALERLRGVPIE
jgi:integrase/recombinase XerC